MITDDREMQNKNNSPALHSWHHSPIRQAIESFLTDVTDKQSEYFVPEHERIAVFDNDGTLWTEKPLLAQLAFFKDRIRPDDDLPRDVTQSGLFAKAVELFEDKVIDLFDDVADLMKELLDGVTTEEFESAVLQWLAEARHPRFQLPWTQLVYQPMLEVLQLFRAHRFQCFIVTGSSTDFVRPWSVPIYNIPQPNIIGSSLRTRLVEKKDRLHLEYLPVPFVITNGDEKVESIARRIGKQPIAAFGNSRGDIEMLRWTGQARRSLCALVHHTDAEREYAYSPDPPMHFGAGTLEQADTYDWQVVDMKRHWRKVFAHDTEE